MSGVSTRSSAVVTDKAPRWQRILMAGIFGYELVALFSPRLPTITHICKTHPAVKAGLIGTLVYHFRREAS